MKRVSKDVLSPLGVSAISCRAQLGQGLRGRHEKPWLVPTVSAEAQSRRGWGRRLRLVPSLLNSSIMVIPSLFEVLRTQNGAGGGYRDLVLLPSHQTIPLGSMDTCVSKQKMS